jgi:hypothetical protein
MAIITKIPRLNKLADKIFKNVYKGEVGSPYKEVDDLGSPPLFRGKNTRPGPEKKKLKEIGEKIKKSLQKKDKEKILKDKQMSGTKYLRGGGISQRGLGRAFMKGGRVR